MGQTKIEWTERTWNPVTGCTKVSPGCDNCYAETIAHRFAGGKSFPNGFDVTLHPERLGQPLRWRKPATVFVNSMSDLFHADVPDEFIADVFAVMQATPRHTYQVLTKRPGRMRSLLTSERFMRKVAWNSLGITNDAGIVETLPGRNVWLGVSVEDQKWANVRIPLLLQTPAFVRFLSCEPLLGPVTIDTFSVMQPGGWRSDIDWVIVGGESGPKARPMHPDWARSLRDQCAAAGVPFFFKQWGEWVEDATYHADGTRTINTLIDHRDPKRIAMHNAGMTAMTKDNPFNPWKVGHPFWTAMRRDGKKAAGRLLDGRTWDEMPARLTDVPAPV